MKRSQMKELRQGDRIELPASGLRGEVVTERCDGVVVRWDNGLSATVPFRDAGCVRRLPAPAPSVAFRPVPPTLADDPFDFDDEPGFKLPPCAAE